MDKVRFCRVYHTMGDIWEYYMVYPDNPIAMRYHYDLEDWCMSLHNAPPIGYYKCVELTRKQCEDEIRAYHIMKELTSDK